MSRLPYAAKTLIGQVQQHRKRAKATEVGDPDGLGVVRTIRFDKSGSRWLSPLIAQVDDPRIKEVREVDGKVEVTFVGGTVADHRDPFPLDAAAVVKDDAGD